MSRRSSPQARSAPGSALDSGRPSPLDHTSACGAVAGERGRHGTRRGRGGATPGRIEPGRQCAAPSGAGAAARGRRNAGPARKLDCARPQAGGVGIEQTDAAATCALRRRRATRTPELSATRIRHPALAPGRPCLESDRGSGAECRWRSPLGAADRGRQRPDRERQRLSHGPALFDRFLQGGAGGELRHARRRDLDLLARSRGCVPRARSAAETLNLPKPENVTSLPRLSASSIVSRTASTASPASFLLNPARSATWSTNSDFVTCSLLRGGRNFRS